MMESGGESQPELTQEQLIAEAAKVLERIDVYHRLGHLFSFCGGPYIWETSLRGGLKKAQKTPGESEGYAPLSLDIINGARSSCYRSSSAFLSKLRQKSPSGSQECKRIDGFLADSCDYFSDAKFPDFKRFVEEQGVLYLVDVYRELALETGAARFLDESMPKDIQDILDRRSKRGASFISAEIQCVKNYFSQQYVPKIFVFLKRGSRGLSIQRELTEHLPVTLASQLPLIEHLATGNSKSSILVTLINRMPDDLFSPHAFTCAKKILNYSCRFVTMAEFERASALALIVTICRHMMTEEQMKEAVQKAGKPSQATGSLMDSFAERYWAKRQFDDGSNLLREMVSREDLVFTQALCFKHLLPVVVGEQACLEFLTDTTDASKNDWPKVAQKLRAWVEGKHDVVKSKNNLLDRHQDQVLRVFLHYYWVIENRDGGLIPSLFYFLLDDRSPIMYKHCSFLSGIEGDFTQVFSRKDKDYQFLEEVSRSRMRQLGASTQSLVDLFAEIKAAIKRFTYETTLAYYQKLQAELEVKIEEQEAYFRQVAPEQAKEKLLKWERNSDAGNPNDFYPARRSGAYFYDDYDLYLSRIAVEPEKYEIGVKILEVRLAVCKRMSYYRKIESTLSALYWKNQRWFNEHFENRFSDFSLPYYKKIVEDNQLGIVCPEEAIARYLARLQSIRTLGIAKAPYLKEENDKLISAPGKILNLQGLMIDYLEAILAELKKKYSSSEPFPERAQDEPLASPTEPLRLKPEDKTRVVEQNTKKLGALKSKISSEIMDGLRRKTTSSAQPPTVRATQPEAEQARQPASTEVVDPDHLTPKPLTQHIENHLLFLFTLLTATTTALILPFAGLPALTTLLSLSGLFAATTPAGLALGSALTAFVLVCSARAVDWLIGLACQHFKISSPDSPPLASAQFMRAHAHALEPYLTIPRRIGSRALIVCSTFAGGTALALLWSAPTSALIALVAAATSVTLAPLAAALLVGGCVAVVALLVVAAVNIHWYRTDAFENKVLPNLQRGDNPNPSESQQNTPNGSSVTPLGPPPQEQLPPHSGNVDTPGVHPR